VRFGARESDRFNAMRRVGDRFQQPSVACGMQPEARATIRIAETEVKFTRLVQPTPIVERALRLVEQLAVAP
jgi:hypothetical protein